MPAGELLGEGGNKFNVDRAKEENDVSKVPRASLNFLHRVGLQLSLSYTSGTSDS